MESTTVTIIIPTFNRAASLERTLQGCVAQSYPSRLVEIIVVNDGGTDHSASVVEKIARENQRNIRYFTQQNAGPAAARNHGIQFASGDLILFLDDDVLPQPDLIEQHVAFRKRFPDYVCQGVVFPSKETHLLDKIMCLNRFSPDIADAMDWEFASGIGNLSVPKAWLVAVGLLDPNLRVMEDLDLTFRIRKNLNKTVKVAAHAIATNQKPANYGLESQMRQHWEAGQYFIRLIRKDADLLNPAFSKQMCQTFESWLKGIPNFSPMSDVELKTILGHIKVLEAHLIPDPKNEEILTVLIPAYQQLLSYSSLEGQYQEWHRLPASGPSTCRVTHDLLAA